MMHIVRAYAFESKVRANIVIIVLTEKGDYMKWFVAAAILLGLSRLDAAGQIGADGTIVIINSSKKEIVFAADSRTTFRHSYSDEECKIHAFGDRILFAASGRGGQRNKITHAYSWDATAFARNAFVTAGKKGTSEHLPEQLASSWGIAMKKQLEKDVAADRSLALADTEKDGTLAMGAFADFEKDGSFLIVIEKLAFSISVDGSIKIDAFVDHRATRPEGPYYIGKGEIIRELDAGTPRSKEWKRNIDLGMGFSPDPTVFLAQALVQLTIDNYPATKVDGAGKRFSIVGGKIAIAKLTPNGFDLVVPGSCSPGSFKAGSGKPNSSENSLNLEGGDQSLQLAR